MSQVMSQVVLSDVLMNGNSLLMMHKKKYICELKSLQKEIYKAAIYHDYKRVHKLQTLLLSSQSIKLIVLLDIISNYSKVNLSTVLNVDSQLQLCTTQDFSNMTKDKSRNLVHKIQAAKLYDSLTDHTIITNLNHRVMSNLVYLCLKPEWEAKFVDSYPMNNFKCNHVYKINSLARFCLQYYKNNNSNKIYILKNKIDILYDTRDLDYAYLSSKLNSIHTIDKFIRRYLVLCSSNSDKFQCMCPSSSCLLFLLKNILIGNLSEEIYLRNNLFMNITHKRDEVSTLPRFLWHSGYFLFFSSNKNEIVYIQDYVTQFFTDVGLISNTKDILMLELNQGFNFLDFYIKSSFRHNKKRTFDNIVIKPSMRSQLILLKEVKYILYHKDQLYRMRPNAYLSFWSAIRKINHSIRRWKKYYYKSQAQNIVDSKLNLSIQLMIYKWQVKKTQKNPKMQTLCNYNFYNKLKFSNVL